VFKVLVIENKEKGVFFYPILSSILQKKGLKFDQKSLQRGDLKNEEL